MKKIKIETTLFGEVKQYSRAEKMKISRKVTTDLTKDAIKYLNDTMQFQVHRSNNFPSPRITRQQALFEAFDIEGNPVKFEYEKVDIHFKSNNITEKILDISGFVLPYNGNDLWAGKHFEIEVKTGKDSLSEGQLKRIADIKAAGGISFVFDSMETLHIQIKPYLVEKKLAF
jgi:hypothetical protein